MESNKILIGVEFSDGDNTIGGFELMVLRDLTLAQLIEGIKTGLDNKIKNSKNSEKEKYEKYNLIFMHYCNTYDTIIVTSSNKGIDSGISISEKGEKKLYELGFITSSRVLFNRDGQAKVYSLNNPENINEAFKEEFPQYNISSRQLSVLDKEAIKIITASEPPQKPKLNILAMILPSLAMTLAMALGRSLFISNGVSSRGMIGLSFLMVAVNIFVSLFNYKRQLKEHREKMLEWKEHYEKYIEKIISKIEKRQEHDAEELDEEYPDIQTLFEYTMKVSERIYSRSRNDKDFLTVRLGFSNDVETLFDIEGDKGDAIFSPTKYKWNASDTGIDIVLYPEKIKSKRDKEQKIVYDSTENYLIDLPYDISHKYEKMKCGNVPLLLSLKDCGTLGVFSKTPYLVNRLINSIIFELCFYHSPEDLQFIMFYGQNDEEDALSPDNVSVQKYKYSSHFRELFNNKSQFVFDEKNAKLMFDSLLNLIYERNNAKDEEQNNDFTQIIVVIYEEYGIKEHALANFLPKSPKDGEAYKNDLGITFVFCKSCKGHLPSYCGNIIEICNKDQLYLTPRHDDNQKKLFSNSVVNLSENRIISGMTDIEIIKKGDFYNRLKVLSALYYTRIAQNAKVPSYITLFELLDVDKDNFSEWIKYNWTRDNRQDIVKTLSVPIGKNENSIVCLDLHEKADGPHMLVAGTTGSGKSETIISYLLGLCFYYTPEELNLLLIDMKGGGFIKRIGNLPHVVGTVTDVDGDENGTGAEYMLKRFLQSLASEVKRRKILFNQMGVDSIGEYIKRRRKLKQLKETDTWAFEEELNKLQLKEVPEPLSHLVFVVDEFTELKRASAEGNDMDFIGEITTIARVGRSLGFHIILISQNIEGAITDDIRVNSKARLCLKVATKQASKEMIGNDKAAASDMPGNGRAYLLVGTGSRFDYFQSAYSGADSSQSLEMPFEIIQAEINGNYTMFYDSAKDSKKQDENAETQLEFIVNQIMSYYNSNIDVYGKPHIIFNQPLPKRIIFERDSVFSYSEKMHEWQKIFTDK